MHSDRLLAVAALFFLGSSWAQTTMELTPSMDNSLYSESGDLSNGAGTGLFSGVTLNGDERRALLAFDLSSLPVGATVTAVELELNMNLTRAGTVEIRAHEVLAAWGEGSSVASGGGGGGGAGGPAQVPDATWTFRRFDTDNWTTPGGDFDAAPFSLVDVGNSGSYILPSTADFVALVQSWLDGTRANNGLILVADPAAGVPSAKRFGSREIAAASSRPVLRVTFEESLEPLSVSGLWFDPSLDGEGFNVIQSDAGTVIFYFGYDSDGNRLWLVSNTVTTPLAQGQTVEFDLLVGEGGSFETPTPSSELTAWGTLSVTLDDCDSGTFVLDGLDGSKTSNAILLAGITGTSCEAPPASR